MELLDNVLLKLNVSTKEIRSEDLQKIMLIVKKTSHYSEQLDQCYNEILAKIWSHLISEQIEFDDQLLYCTCFYSILSYSKSQELYLNKILQIIINEILFKRVKNDERHNSSLAVSLCYGVFQSSYLMQHRDKPLKVLENLLKETFQLITLMAYEYSQHTFIAFKTLTAFKKVIGTPFQDFLYTRDNKIKLLNLINHNWENPITGVRNLNRIIFQSLLLLFDHDVYERVLNEINKFYWNKAKFLMLTEFIEHSNGDTEHLVTKNEWIHGLIYSLHNPGLVSAGADMYYAILKKLTSENCWSKLYLINIIKILAGSSLKAIDNFSNYWCLTTFKKFPTVAGVIFYELQKLDEFDLKLYSYISVLKQANKLGLVEKTWMVSKHSPEESIVVSALEHCNSSIRMLAFEIICSSSQKRCLPSDIEFQQVLKFLKDNVNSDCTILRINTLTNLANFFITMHTSFLNYYKHDPDDEEYLCNLQVFCKHLQFFIINSLNLNGNYQRKITTVKIAYLILKHFNEVPRKKQKQTRDMTCSLIEYLKDNQLWLLNSKDYIMKLIRLLKDPATDVQDCILQLLLDFYLPDISETTTMNHLIEESLKCIQSKFFFEISCGLNMMKLIINIILKKENVAAKFRNIDDIFYFAYNELITQYNAKLDVVESIVRGKQLHSILSMLCVIFDVILRNSYPMKSPSLEQETTATLLNILKYVSNQFALEEDTTTSSDFSKMNDMVLSLIKSSGFHENLNDQTKISGLYQIVLNCLWLNVKASCELAAVLIQYYKGNVTICEECLNIIAHVLETSRHKGAIEAAGVALGQGIRCLTSPGIESEVSRLPLLLLERKLNELLLETTRMSSITRRGAGLSIMIHKIVSNDAKKGKPLFHYFMKTILNTCISLLETCDKNQKGDEKDLPKAIYIHFLTKVVADSSLASDMMYYSAELAELAFGNLMNPHWQIRNAALQLYGALIPKLIGQKKPSGTDDVILSSVACDEFRTHSPKLWDSIVKQIKNDNNQDIIQKHSNLVPILNTLANIALKYNFSYNLNEQIDSDLNLLPYVLDLLGSPIYTVRRLASKCIINIYSFEIIYNVLRKLTITSENHLHGILMVIENCYKEYSDVKLYKTLLNSLRNEYSEALRKGNHSYLCQWSLEKLFIEDIPEETTDILWLKNILHKEKTTNHEPGAHLWINKKIQTYLQKITWSNIPMVLSLLLNTCDFENYCEIIAQRICSDTVPENVLLDVSKILLTSDLKTKSPVLWKTLYFISGKIHFSLQLSTSFLQEHLNHISFNMRYMIPFATRALAVQGDNINLLLISNKIYMLCNPESNDIDMRYTAAMANNELGYKFKSFSDDIRINAIKSAVILLQDEDEDIRNLSVMFYKRVVDRKDPKHPFICLNEILKRDFLCSHLIDPVSSKENICKDLLLFIDAINISKGDLLNPFANDSKNIYLEVNVLQQLLVNLNKAFE